MSEENHDIDVLLRRNVDRQLETFDWDELSGRISDRLEQAECKRLSPRHRWPVMAAAAVLALALVSSVAVWRWGPRPGREPGLLQQIMAGALDAGPLDAPTSTADDLIAGTDPETILLTSHVHLVCGDPLVRPHSPWDQMPASTGHVKEISR